MADFIRAPWIRDYLVEVAETYGGDLANLPYHNRKKGQFVKVSLLVFLRPRGERVDDRLLSLSLICVGEVSYCRTRGG